MRLVLLIAVSALWANAPALAQIQTVWSRVYDSPRNDRPVTLARDSQDNAIVLVDADGATAVVKYSPAGTTLWTRPFDTPLRDIAEGMTVAPDDSIHVAVVSTTGSAPGSLTLRKIAPGGGVLWSREGDLTGVLPDNRMDLATDSAGNVFVAALNATGYVFLKYDASGLPQWTNSYAIPADSYGTTKYFGTDAAGNAVLVSGLIDFEEDKLLIVRCSPSGAITSTVREWAAPNDFLTAARVDADGNVFVAASVVQLGWAYQLFVAKYNATDEQVWSTIRQRSPGFYHVVSYQMVLDSLGRPIVTAYETRPVDEDDDEYQTLTVAYSPSGEELWSARAQGFDRRPTGLAVDRDNNIHVVAADSAGQSTLLVKYRPNGSQAAQSLLTGHSPGHIVTGAPGEFYVNFDPGAETRKFLHVDSQPPLSATIEPGWVEVLPGTSVTFTAVVSGPGPFTYDWRYLGYRTGGTNATFTVANPQFQWFSHGPYSVIVSNATGYTISPQAQLTVLRPPAVLLTPATVFAVAGESATFTTSVGGTEPISYFWFLNGKPIPGASGSNLVLSGVQPTDAGSYSVMASNRAGTALSSGSPLHVVLPPKSFANTSAIDFRTNTTASPYPAEIFVSGVTGQVLKITSTLHGLTTSVPGELAVLLEAPDGSSLALMSEDADDATADGVTLTFDDYARGYMPDDPLQSGTFKPSRYSAPILPAPAPLEPRVSRLSAFIPGGVNGTWRLYVAEPYLFSAMDYPGQIAGGWSLAFHEADPNAVIGTSAPRITRIEQQGDQVVIEWQGAPGWTLQRSTSLAEPQWSDVAGSLGASRFELPIDSASQFFRLTK